MAGSIVIFRIMKFFFYEQWKENRNKDNSRQSGILWENQGFGKKASRGFFGDSQVLYYSHDTCGKVYL